MMQIQYTKNLNPGRFELCTTLSYRKRSNKRPLSNKRLLPNNAPPLPRKLPPNTREWRNRAKSIKISYENKHLSLLNASSWTPKIK